MNTMLAGLCNLCNDFGHSNFDATCTLAQEISSLPGTNVDHAVRKDLRDLQTFLRRKFHKLLQRHSPRLELCMSHALVTCSEEHADTVQEIKLFYSECQVLEEALETSSCGVPVKAKSKERLEESVSSQPLTFHHRDQPPTCHRHQGQQPLCHHHQGQPGCSLAPAQPTSQQIMLDILVKPACTRPLSWSGNFLLILASTRFLAGQGVMHVL